MILNQRNKFRIPKEVSYLNCAFMSPLLIKSEKAGHTALSQKCLPYEITSDDFFSNTLIVKQLFAQLVDIKNFENIAIIPSVSYGIATVANNVILKENDEILIVGEQFPSNVYSWQSVAEKNKAKIVIVSANKEFLNRGKKWNNKVLNAINKNTKIVALPHVHWSDGTLFNLKAIRKRTREVNALLIIDGTQSVGALPFSVDEIQPDALICASYKWMFGPYSIGLAYYSDELCLGKPIEESWINRKNSEDFSGLVNYESNYQPKAGRFNVGQASNFALNPILIESLMQLLAWKPENIQQHCYDISNEAIIKIKAMGCFIEDNNYRGSHLFGIYLPESINLKSLKKEFLKQHVFVSFRGDSIRVSPHVYNTIENFNKLVQCFENVI